MLFCSGWVEGLLANEVTVVMVTIGTFLDCTGLYGLSVCVCVCVYVYVCVYMQAAVYEIIRRVRMLY